MGFPFRYHWFPIALLEVSVTLPPVQNVVGPPGVIVGVAGPFGSVLLAGLLLGAGLFTFGVLLATTDSSALSSALGVATLLIASGVAFSFRELFRNRAKPTEVAVARPDDET